MNEVITIARLPFGWQTFIGKEKGARLVWQAPGIDIYVKGSLAGMGYEQVANIAMNECIGRNIPIPSLRNVSAETGTVKRVCRHCGRSFRTASVTENVCAKCKRGIAARG